MDSGIRRVKVGASAKETAFLIPLKSLICIFFGSCVFFFVLATICVRLKEAGLGDRRRLSSVRSSHIEKELQNGRNAAMKLLQIGIELEAHLQLEKDYDKNEERFLSQARAFSEDLRGAAGRAIDREMTRLRERIETLGDDENSQENVLDRSNANAIVNEAHEAMSSAIDRLLETFGNDLSKLGETDLKKARKVTSIATKRIASVRTLVRETSDEIATTADEDAPNESERSELRHVASKFVELANERYDTVRSAHLKSETLRTIEMYRREIELRNAKEVLIDTTKLLFPSGRRELATSHNFAPYEGGSVEAYLENIIYSYKYKTDIWPKIERVAAKWKSGDLDTPTTVRTFAKMALDGEVPATWLIL